MVENVRFRIDIALVAIKTFVRLVFQRYYHFYFKVLCLDNIVKPVDTTYVNYSNVNLQY